MRALSNRCLGLFGALFLGACSGDVGSSPTGDGRGGREPTQPTTPGTTIGGGPTTPGTSPPGTPGTPAVPGLPTTPGTSAPPPVLGSEGDPNGLDAAKLFTCGASDRVSSPPRLWRLNADQYRATIDAVGGKTSGNAFAGATSDEKFANYASAFGMDGVTLDQLLDSHDLVSRSIIDNQKRTNACLAAAALTEPCLRPVMGRLATAAFRRPVTDDETTRYVRLVLDEQTKLGPQVALQLGVEAIIDSPYFVFRFELGEGSPDAAGRRKLGPYEVASAVAYTAGDGPPDKMLLDAAAANALGTPAQIRPHVIRLLEGQLTRNTPSFDSQYASVFLQFFRQYVRHYNVMSVFKDPKKFAFHRDWHLVQDGEAFLLMVMREKKDFLTGMLTRSDFPIGKYTGGSYVALDADQRPIPNQAGDRFGILTHPVWLAGFSGNEETDPIRRGKLVRENLLCLPVPKLPIDEIPPLPELPNATMREKLAQHTADPKCAACHQFMDPIGLGLEAYDHAGRQRSVEAGRPVDSRGVLQGAGPASDGPFTGGRALGQKLAASPLVPQCFVRNAARFFWGRNETYEDACALSAALESYKTSGGNAVEAITTLLTSDSFLYRK